MQPLRKATLIAVLVTLLLSVACGNKSVEGKYRDPSGVINAEFKDGKAYIALGMYAVNGTYTVDGNKIIASGNFGLMIPSPCVFTMNKDGSIDGPQNSPIPRLQRVSS